LLDGLLSPASVATASSAKSESMTAEKFLFLI